MEKLGTKKAFLATQCDATQTKCGVFIHGIDFDSILFHSIPYDGMEIILSFSDRAFPDGSQNLIRSCMKCNKMYDIAQTNVGLSAITARYIYKYIGSESCSAVAFSLPDVVPVTWRNQTKPNQTKHHITVPPPLVSSW